jgi:hypothetical protein
MYAFRPGGALLVVTAFNSPVLVGLIWTTRGLNEKKAKIIKMGPVIQPLQLTALSVEGVYGNRNNLLYP